MICLGKVEEGETLLNVVELLQMAALVVVLCGSSINVCNG